MHIRPTHFVLIVCVLILLAAGGRFYMKHTVVIATPPQESTPTDTPLGRAVVHVGEATIVAEKAITLLERAQGLSGRTTLADGEGMLFFFDAPGRPGFWMHDMHIPLDMIWFDSDWRVVSVTENATPESYPEQFYPVEPAQYVLEVPAFYAKRNGIVRGVRATVDL